MKVQTLTLNFQPAIKNTGCCPHGNPMGACKLCMGGGGGLNTSKPKAKPTPRELGLLTWADLLPAWYAMLAAQANAKNNKEFNMFIELRNLMNKNQILQNLEKFFNTQIKPIGNNVKKVIIKTVKKLVRVTSNFFADLKAQLTQQISKMLVTIVANQFVKNIFEKFNQIKLASEHFVSLLKEKEFAIKDLASKLAKKVKKKLRSVIKASFFEKLFG